MICYICAHAQDTKTLISARILLHLLLSSPYFFFSSISYWNSRCSCDMSMTLIGDKNELCEVVREDVVFCCFCRRSSSSLQLGTCYHEWKKYANSLSDHFEAQNFWVGRDKKVIGKPFKVSKRINKVKFILMDSLIWSHHPYTLLFSFLICRLSSFRMWTSKTHRVNLNITLFSLFFFYCFLVVLFSFPTPQIIHSFITGEQRARSCVWESD